MINRFLTLLTIISVFFFFIACNSEKSNNDENISSDKKNLTIQDRLDMYAPISLTASIDHLSDNEKEALKHLIKASNIIDEIFWFQAFGDKVELYDKVSDLDIIDFININYGPWDRFNGNESFVEGIGKKPIGANFYPHDIKYLPFIDMKFEDKFSMFTVIRKAEDGSLYTRPYNVEYKDLLERAAEHLNEAAKFIEDAAFKNFLKLRAKALLSDNYYESDLAWMDLKNNNIDIIIGPIESSEDRFLNTKLAYQSFLLLKDHVWSKKLETYISFLDELKSILPVNEQYRDLIIGSKADVGVYEAIYYAGWANAGGKSISINHPKDGRIILEKGNKKLQFKNVMEAKFNFILSRIAAKILNKEQLDYVKFEAFFINNLFYEIADAFIIKNTINNEPVKEALKDYYVNINAVKSNILRLYLLCKMHERGLIQEVDLKDNITTFMSDIFRSVRFGSSYAQGTANIVCFNTFQEQNAFIKDSEGKYFIDFDKMKIAIENLTKEVLTILGDGDFEAARILLTEKGIVSAQLQKDINIINTAGIPTDIRLKQGIEIIGLN